MSVLRILLRLLAVIGMLAVIPPLLLVTLLLTESGSSWLISQLPVLLRPLDIQFSVASSRGSLRERLELNRPSIVLADNRFAAEQLILYWHPAAIFDRKLHIAALQLSDVRLQLPPAEETPPTPPELPDIMLPIALQVDQLLVERFLFEQGENRQTIQRAALALNFDERGLMLRDLHYEAGGVQLTGALSMAPVKPHVLDGTLELAADQSLTGEQVGAVQAVAHLQGTALEPKVELQLNAPTELRVHAALNLAQLEPGFELRAEWPGLSWPLQGAAMVSATAGSLTLSGVPSDYRLGLDTGISGEGIPTASVELTAQGNLQELHPQPLLIRTLEGVLRVNGSIGWEEKLQWNLQLLAEQINPGGYLPEWPGRIHGRVDVSGALDEQVAGGIGVKTLIHELAGELRGQAISASGGLDYRSGTLLADQLKIASGPNRVFLDGRADDRLDLTFDIAAPDLAALLPGLSGELAGKGRLVGTRQSPAITAELAGSGIGYQTLLSQRFKLNLNWQEGSGQGELKLTGVEGQGFEISEVSAQLSGTESSHRFELKLMGEPYRAELSAEGGLHEGVWQGELARLKLTEPNLGEWRLQDPVKLQLGQTKLRSGLLCLMQEKVRFCSEGGWSEPQGLDLVGRLEELDFARLAPLMPGPAVIEGVVHGEFKLSGATQQPNLLFRLNPGNGLIRVEQDAEPLAIAYRNARVSGSFAKDQGSVDLNFELGENGQARGRLLLGAEQKGVRPLGGEVNVEFPDLALVAGFVPALEKVAGRLHLQAALGGSVAQPKVTGALQIERGSAVIQPAGITLSDIQLMVRGEGGSPLQVHGALRSGEGQLAVTGAVDLAAAAGPAVDLRLKGNNFQAVRLPEAVVTISPDLSVQGSGKLHLSGDLLIPKAAIVLRELPSGAVAVSEDEIVVTRQVEKKHESQQQKLTAQVRVVLGDKVTFKGFGLETGLTGAVVAGVDSKGTSVNGKIELRDGRYKSYGQNLTVEQGRLLFAGPPGNPDVDLRAIRMSRDAKVKAILALSGPLSKPRPRIYSEPALPDAEVLAYLLTGNKISQAGKSEGADIAGAALSLGLSEGEPLLQQMSERLGLDELRVDSGDGGVEGSSLVLGKYLNPDLYLGYSQGLFNPEGAVLLRLKLSEKLELESRSGNEQSVDLFYRLEHD
ncbi:MAG: translocation/assembly module TamB domain-containing protein [Chromatiaceae bacterium]|nr:translocation/assembly module TamB domain-containing protein [Chromatiaceae bacterium]